MIDQFLTERCSEEFFNFTEAEHAAVMADGFEGYSEWSTELEADAWRGSKPVGDILYYTCAPPKCAACRPPTN